MKNKKEKEICENCRELKSEHIDYFETGKKNVCPHRKSFTFSPKKFKAINSPQGNTTKEGSISSPEDNSKEDDSVPQNLVQKEEFCLNDEIKRKIKFETDDIKSHRCRAKNGYWCMDCEIANARGTALYEALEDVKEFIKKLKEDYDKRIDKIQKSFKTTEDPFVAMKRFELMKILCGFVDNLDKLAGPDLI